MKLLVKILAFTFVFIAPAFFVPVLAAAAVAHVYDQARARRSMAGSGNGSGQDADRPLSRGERMRAAKADRERREQALRDLSVEYDGGKGWNVGALPLDMRADLTGGRKGVARFTCAGIEGLVTGVPRDGKVKYTFRMRDLERAKEVQRKARNYNGTASVEQAPDGSSFIVTAYSAAAINELARTAFPETRVNVRRRVTHSMYYVMEGYAGRKEALAAFGSSRDSLTPVYSDISVVDTVDGQERVRTRAVPYSPDSLPYGSFVIRVDESSEYGGTVSVSSDAPGEDLAARASALFDEDAAREARALEPVVTDVTPAGVVRTVEMDDGRLLPIGGPEDGAPGCYIVVNGMDALADLLNEGVVARGSLVIVDRDRPSLEDGQFCVELSSDVGLGSLLAVQGGASATLAARCEAMGIGRDVLEASLLREEKRRNGYATAVLREDVSLERALVNGVPLKDLADRLSDERLERLDRDRVKRWLEDAAKIRAVSITIDAKKAEMRITSVVNDVQKVETRKLTDREMAALAKRGEFTRAEMKDMLMQVHPDFFATYSEGGKSVFVDPVKDFIAGRKPRRLDEVKRSMAEARRKEPRAAMAEARRTRGPKMV